MNKKPMTAETSTALQELWDKCQEGDREAKKMMLDVTFDKAIHNFGRMFIPYRFMGSDKKCGHVIRKFDIDVTLRHKDLFGCEAENAEVALKIGHSGILQSILVRAEQIIKEHTKARWKKGIPTPAKFQKAVRSELWDAEMPATHMWVGGEVLDALLHSEEWVQYVTVTAPKELVALKEPNSEKTALNAMFGSFLKVLDTEVYTDGLRYDTLQVLTGDEWCIFSNRQVQKVWVEWSTENVHDFKARRTAIAATVRIGTEVLER